MSTPPPPIVSPIGFAHVRLTVTDIARSKEFYRRLFGAEPVFDFSDRVDEPGVRQDPARFFGGAGFAVGNQILGLRPAAPAGDTFESTRVGLDHLCLAVQSVADVRAAADRLTDAGIAHGDVTELTDLGQVILSIQDPDDINLELSARLDPS